MDSRITPEIVAKAVVAKGQVHDHGGIGASMRAALEAVVDDILIHNQTLDREREYV